MFFSLAASAAVKPETDLKSSAPTTEVEHRIPRGAEITVEDYDAKTDTFLLTINDESAIGPNFVTPEMLRRAVTFSGDHRDFMRQKNQMIGSIFQLKTELPLIRETEMERRNKKAPSGERAF